MAYGFREPHNRTPHWKIGNAGCFAVGWLARECWVALRARFFYQHFSTVYSIRSSSPAKLSHFLRKNLEAERAYGICFSCLTALVAAVNGPVKEIR